MQLIEKIREKSKESLIDSKLQKSEKVQDRKVSHTPAHLPHLAYPGVIKNNAHRQGAQG